MSSITRIGRDSSRRVFRQRRVEIQHALLAQLHDAIGEHGLGVGARGEHRVVVHRFVRARVLDAERAPPRELAVANDRDRHGGHLGFLEPCRNSGLPPGNQGFQKYILGSCRTLHPVGVAREDGQQAQCRQTALDQKVAAMQLRHPPLQAWQTIHARNFILYLRRPTSSGSPLKMRDSPTERRGDCKTGAK